LALAYAYIALYFVVAQNTIEGLIEYIEKSDVTRKEKKATTFSGLYIPRYYQQTSLHDCGQFENN